MDYNVLTAKATISGLTSTLLSKNVENHRKIKHANIQVEILQVSAVLDAF